MATTTRRKSRELDSDRGKHPKWTSLISDENVQAAVTSFICDNGYIKGRPNLTLIDVVSWVKTTYDVEVSKSCVSLWLHQLGFTYVQHTKGVYFDGHERTDVVARRRAYLDTLHTHDKLTWYYHSPCRDPAIQSIIRVYHDESTYYANADQSFHWTDGTKHVLKKKSLGQSIMVSDFVEEVGGMLQCGDDKATLQLETHTDGYFTNDKLISQTHKAISIFESKYPHCQALFIFDNAPSHMKKPQDALNAETMNVGDGGKQPFLRDTVWQGKVQRMVTSAGIQKGMKTVLEERGVNPRGMNADKMREEIRQFQDFQDSTTILEEEVHQRGHICLYLPKFHCELNPIEQVWCHSKKYTRSHCNGTITRSRKIVPQSLSLVTKDTIGRFFSKCRDYETAYRDGHTCQTVDKVVKKYKSHRRVKEAE